MKKSLILLLFLFSCKKESSNERDFSPIIEDQPMVYHRANNLSVDGLIEILDIKNPSDKQKEKLSTQLELYQERYRKLLQVNRELFSQICAIKSQQHDYEETSEPEQSGSFKKDDSAYQNTVAVTFDENSQKYRTYYINSNENPELLELDKHYKEEFRSLLNEAARIIKE